MVKFNRLYLNGGSPSHRQSGLALITTLVLVILVGVISVSGMRMTEISEMLSGNSIQRSRAFQAAEGALMIGEANASLAAEKRIFASSRASEGVFSKGSVDEFWWRQGTYSGAVKLDDGAFPGVVDSPEYVTEEIGGYVSDAGSGIVSLDRGAASYGGKTKGGREVMLYRIQTFGVGSTANAKAVVESHFVADQ